MENEKYEVEILCEGKFRDRQYAGRVITFRINGAAMDGWIDSEVENPRAMYKTDREYEEYRDSCVNARVAWTKEIRALLGWQEGESCYITEIYYEIYTAVFMKREVL